MTYKTLEEAVLAIQASHQSMAGMGQAANTDWVTLNNVLRVRQAIPRLFVPGPTHAGPCPCHSAMSPVSLRAQETPADVVFLLEVGDLLEEDLTLVLSREGLLISGHHADGCFAFQHMVSVPPGTESSEIRASLDAGVLSLRLPKADPPLGR